MVTAAHAPMAVFELPHEPAGAGARGSAVAGGAGRALPGRMLLDNARWFCRLRWVVIALLGAFGLAAGWPAPFAPLDLRAVPAAWPFVAAGVLAAANALFILHVARLAPGLVRDAEDRASAAGVVWNLWAQILVDLLVLSAVVHYVGSLETFVGFAYLFHIALACIFFPRGQSGLVTGLACALYGALIALERAGAWPAHGIYADLGLRRAVDEAGPAWLLNALSAPAVWVVVWYLTSALSSLVRQRDRELEETNRRVLEAQEEKTRSMLRTAHELKSPFAGIHANVQLLLQGYCGQLPPEAIETVGRISARSQRLAMQVQEMLQLAYLRAPDSRVQARGVYRLDRLLAEAAAHCEPVAARRGVTIRSDLQPAEVEGVAQQLAMMLGNLVTNAVVYSREGGVVELSCGRRPADDRGAPVGESPSGHAFAVIADHGIGIRREDLPRIFEEYYRTADALRHNKESTGLGLAIVRQVAETHGIRLRVESAPGVGTTFTLDFSAVRREASQSPTETEPEGR